MKYIIMCGGNYKDKFDTPKQLIEVNGEKLVERTIRLLRNNEIDDIAISTDCDDFDYLDVEILKRKRQYIHNDKTENKKSERCWLTAYYPMEEPACYLHGDVYYSDEAIKKIIDTEVKDTMFFCVRDIQDGRPTGINVKGREPLAYKVENQKLFRNAINDILKMVDDGKYENIIPPFSWHLYRYINGLDYTTNDLGHLNNIFQDKGDYLVIDDYSTDVDSEEDIKKIETSIKIYKGEIDMIKVEVIENFHLSRFGELKNLVRNSGETTAGLLRVGDVFECTNDLYEYLTTKNALGRPFVKLLEIIPEEVKKEEVKEEPVQEVKKPVTKRRVARKK